MNEGHLPLPEPVPEAADMGSVSRLQSKEPAVELRRRSAGFWGLFRYRRLFGRPGSVG